MELVKNYLNATKEKEQEKSKKKGPFYIRAVLAFFFVGVVMWIWPKVIPFTFWQFWEVRGSIQDWFTTSWFFFAWGIVLLFITYFAQRNNMSWFERQQKNNLTDMFLGGLIVSTWAGVVEEISYRWLLFYGSIISVKIANFIFLGFVGINIVAWIHLHIVGVIADVATLRYLHDFLFHPASWAVGAGILASSAGFRQGHAYQSILGWIDSWFFSMLMFYILFQYGIVACIVLHFAYDLMLIYFFTILDSIVKKVT
jgi:hypothetical protein